MFDDAIFTAIAGAFIILGIIVIAFYLVDAFARYKYLKVRNYPCAWMAFLPIANVYATVEATYGNVETIKVYGIEMPAIGVKLFPVLLSCLAGIGSQIPGVGSTISSLLGIVTIAFMVAIYIDVLKRIRKEMSLPFAIIANIFSIVGSIYLLISCNGLNDGQYDYKSDANPLYSQTRTTVGI